MEKRIADFQIINHGVDHAQYFQGCGVAFTSYDDAVTGIGDNAREAYDDALEQLASCGYDVGRLPSRPRGIRQSDTVDAHLRRNGEDPKEQPEDSELWYYVSIRVRAATSKRERFTVPCPSCGGTGGIGHCQGCHAAGRVVKYRTVSLT
jgi:hypothetical protein